jgi:hypothetical protein
MKSEFGIRMSLYISISFKMKIVILFCGCRCVEIVNVLNSTKKEHDFRGIVFLLAVVCGCVCVYDLYNCIIWNNRVFSSVGAGCVVCMVDLYIFLYSCLY